MFSLLKKDTSNKDFKSLIQALDAELAIRDGADHAFYNQFNGIADIKYALVGYVDGQPVACGAIKKFDEQSMEVKRMFVSKAHRGNGYAMTILVGLQSWAKDLGFQKCILETGKKQHEAIGLYHKANFKIIDNYGQYIGMKNSVCFSKDLII